MIKVMIIEDNIANSKALVNLILKKNPDAKLFVIAMKREDGIKYLKNDKMDIVIVTLKKKDIEENFFEQINIERFKDSLIISSEIDEFKEKYDNNPHVYAYINKSEGKLKLADCFSNLLKLKMDRKTSGHLEQNICKELESLGFNIGHNGTKYIIETIKLLYKDTAKTNLTKDVYPIIANKHNKTVTNIKTNIAKATDYMYYECEENFLKEYFDFKEIIKPKPKVVIRTIIKKLNQY